MRIPSSAPRSTGRMFLSLASTLIWALSSTGTALAADNPSVKKGIPIHVRDYLGIQRPGEPVTFAVPLKASDKIRKTKELIVLGPNGRHPREQQGQEQQSEPDEGTQRDQGHIPGNVAPSLPDFPIRGIRARETP